MTLLERHYLLMLESGRPVLLYFLARILPVLLGSPCVIAVVLTSPGDKVFPFALGPAHASMANVPLPVVQDLLHFKFLLLSQYESWRDWCKPMLFCIPLLQQADMECIMHPHDLCQLQVICCRLYLPDDLQRPYPERHELRCAYA